MCQCYYFIIVPDGASDTVLTNAAARKLFSQNIFTIPQQNYQLNLMLFTTHVFVRSIHFSTSLYKRAYKNTTREE